VKEQLVGAADAKVHRVAGRQIPTSVWHRCARPAAALLAVSAIALLFAPPAPAASGTQLASSQYGYPYPNAPDCPETGASSRGCVLDSWNFYQGQCTSWVAYRLNQRSHVSFRNDFRGQHFGSAYNWGPAARRAGIAVNGTPAVGAVAWYSFGHVAYVEQTSPSVVISEMNFNYHNGFRTLTIKPGNHWPTGFVHFRDLRPSAATEAPTPTPTPSPLPPPVKAPPPAPGQGSTDRLSNDGHLLASGSEYLRSADGRYRFVMQQDSNLVLYGPSGRALWASNTVGRGAREARMQGDGNLVIYTAAGKPIWASNTARHYHAYLVVQNDGNVVIYEGHTPLWATGTDGRT
jgi:surface antigen